MRRCTCVLNNAPLTDGRGLVPPALPLSRAVLRCEYETYALNTSTKKTCKQATCPTPEARAPAHAEELVFNWWTVRSLSDRARNLLQPFSLAARCGKVRVR